MKVEMGQWNDLQIDEKLLYRQYRDNTDIRILADFWHCSESAIKYKLKTMGACRPRIKLDPEIPGERDWILNEKNQIAEIRTCYDTPKELPDWEYNEDDEQED